jgi:transcriptional regulator with XRE-family HTH domain
VDEAIRRRKAEKLTQRRHAALAGVSVPTIIAFDRGERTLSLAKAFDILRVVGLIEEPLAQGTQERFVADAFARWRQLTEKLPPDSPARFPNGWYRLDYALEGELTDIELHRFEAVLVKAVTRLTGWPAFWIPTREAIAPREIDGTIECWLGPGGDDVEPAFSDAAHCDFWRVAPTGRAFLIRGYQEDAQETFAPATIFDPGLPIWRLGEGLVHAANLAALMAVGDPGRIGIRFRALYTGLLGRVLKAWANPLATLLVDGSAARGDEAVLEIATTVAQVREDLAKVLFPMIATLYERFGVVGLSIEGVRAEVDRLLKKRA